MKTTIVPDATYRIQFTPQFGFRDAIEIVTYLRKLGISHIYASPVARSRRGSTHGYDVCDHNEINPELGTIEEFEELLNFVKKQNMGWIQDIVPNHMAYSHQNPYLVDVLEYGISSKYADFFDVTWNHQYESMRNRLLAPFLGKPYGQCIADGDLKLVYEFKRLWVAYYDQRYPLSPFSYRTVLGDSPEGTDSSYPGSWNGNLVNALNGLNSGVSPPATAVHARMRDTIYELYTKDSEIQAIIDKRIDTFQTGNAYGNSCFDKLMQQQNFRLAYWKIATEELNYRRFFTVSDLICIKPENEQTFELTHSLILEFVNKNLINGLRIDHIDGLFNPSAYLEQLRSRAPDCFIVVEKILDKNEMLPSHWPVQGTTGYDFLNHLGYLYCDTRSEKKFTSFYEKVTHTRHDVQDLLQQKKRLIIGKHMAGDIDNLANLILRISDIDLMGRDITLYALRRALVEVLVHFPVYRTYITPATFNNHDATYITKALSCARETMPEQESVFMFIERFLMMQGGSDLEKRFDDEWKKAVMRFQQFTGPLMAKGFEDTVFYIFNRHIALNEVGGWPLHFGITATDFHLFISKRRSLHPFAMNATATHDTKRGEDTRARLQVLSEIPAEWAKQVTLWRKYNTPHIIKHNGKPQPDSNDEYLLYQTLTGTLPVNADVDNVYKNRVKEYMLKAIREAKVHTAWIKPDEVYEKNVIGFVDAVLDNEKSPLFLDSLRIFCKKITWHGILNSLSQVILKVTLPGLPDFYQGTEFWDFSLVDPDNRRPVDYKKRIACLENGKTTGLESLLTDYYNEGNKALLTKLCLDCRNQYSDLFRYGSYQPLTAKGVYKSKIIGFVRSFKGQTIITVIARFTTDVSKAGQLPTGRLIWQDTRICFPNMFKGSIIRNIFTSKEFVASDSTMVGDIFETYPFAVLIVTK